MRCVGSLSKKEHAIETVADLTPRHCHIHCAINVNPSSGPNQVCIILTNNTALNNRCDWRIHSVTVYGKASTEEIFNYTTVELRGRSEDMNTVEGIA